MELNKVFGNIAGLIRLIFLVLIFILVFKAINAFVNRVGSSIPEYTTQHFSKPQYRPPSDVNIRGLEHITQEKIPPLIVYDTVYYDKPGYNYMIRSLKADGKTIKIQTQYCDTNYGSEYIFPYTPMFQVVPLPDSIDFTVYKNYFDFTGVSFAFKRGLDTRSEVLCKTGIEYVPLRLEIELWASIGTLNDRTDASDYNVGIIIEKRFW